MAGLIIGSGYTDNLKKGWLVYTDNLNTEINKVSLILSLSFTREPCSNISYYIYYNSRMLAHFCYSFMTGVCKIKCRVSTVPNSSLLKYSKSAQESASHSGCGAPVFETTPSNEMSAATMASCTQTGMSPFIRNKRE
jgi:hypothetical protein